MELFDPVRGSSEPDRVWCITNVAEATPDLLSPLCWSVWGRALEESWLGCLHRFGVISRRETIPSDDPNQRSTSAIYGRQAFNVAGCGRPWPASPASTRTTWSGTSWVPCGRPSRGQGQAVPVAVHRRQDARRHGAGGGRRDHLVAEVLAGHGNVMEVKLADDLSDEDIIRWFLYHQPAYKGAGLVLGPVP